MESNKFIGNRIKSIRESRKITIEELAERSGLQTAVIEEIENNTGLPSLASLIKIARVVGVRLGTFLDDADEAGPIISRKTAHTGDAGFATSNGTGRRNNMAYFPLSSEKAGRHMEPFVIHIEPSRGKPFDTSSHEGEEFIYCLEGVVEVTYGNHTYLLDAGDSIYYDSIVAHHVHAAGENEAKILAVVYTPF